MAFGLLYLCWGVARGAVLTPTQALLGLVWEIVIGASVMSPAFILGFAPGWLWLHRRGSTRYVSLGGLGLAVGAITPAIVGFLTASLSAAAPFILLFGLSMAVAGAAVRFAAYGGIHAGASVGA